MKHLERRYNHGAEHRAEALDEGWLRQLVAVFNEPTELWPGYVEEVDSEAFSRTLEEGDPVALFNHDASQVLGRQSAKTARFNADEKGLVVDFNPGDTSVGANLRVWLERGDVRGGSFGFLTIEHVVTEQKDGTVLRRLLDVDLIDGGPVTFPAYPQTARSCGLDVDDELLAAARVASRADKPLPTEYRSALLAAVEELGPGVVVRVGAEPKPEKSKPEGAKPGGAKPEGAKPGGAKPEGAAEPEEAEEREAEAPEEKAEPDGTGLTWEQTRRLQDGRARMAR